MIQTLQRWLLGADGPSAIAGRDAAAAGRDAFVNCSFFHIEADPVALEKLTRLVRTIESGTAPLEREVAELSRRLEVSEQALAAMLASSKKAEGPSVAGLAGRVRRHKDALSDLDGLRNTPGFGKTYLEVRSKINAGDFKGAEAVVARETERKAGFGHQHEAHFILFRADLAFLDLRYSQAGHLYLAAGELLESHDVFEAAVCLTHSSDVLYLSGDPLSEQAASKALTLLNAARKPDDLLTAHAFQKLGNSLNRLGHIAAAEDLYRKAVHQFWKNQNVAEPIDVADSLTHLGIILYDTDRISEACRLWDQALTFLDRGEEDARTLGLKASLLKRLDRHDQALPLAQRQLSAAQKMMGANDAWLWSSNYLVASVFYELRQYFQALPYAKRAVEQAEIAVGASHSLLIQNLHLLVQILLEVGHAAEAEPFIRRALKIAQATAHPDVVAIGTSFVFLGSVLFQLNRILPAEKAFAQGIKTLKTVGNSRILAEALCRFAFELIFADRHAKVESLFREALSLCESIYPSNHYNLLHVRIALGQYLLLRGRGEEGANAIIDAHRANPNDPRVKEAFESLKRLAGYH